MKGAWWILTALLCAAGGQAVAQEGKAPWEEYDKLISKRTAVTALGPDLFGDNVDLASGALSFSVTDISLPGNSALPVALTRTLSVTNRKGDSRDDSPMADWELDLPRLSGVFATTWHESRCTTHRPPTVGGGIRWFGPDEYWQGNHAQMPGGGEMLRTDPGTRKPSTGGPYPWMTAGLTFFSCEVPKIKNGSGEGFLAITADGTRYWFDWMAQEAEAAIKSADGAFQQSRRKTMLYATRVEDRFGNWVTYTFTNSATQPAQLTAIKASDGRQITLAYNAAKHVTSASDGTRTWTYTYAYPSSYRATLTGVVLPDASRWSIDFMALSRTEIWYQQTTEPGGGTSRCGSPGIVENKDPVQGTVTHPSGAVGVFVVRPQRHGRSNVPMVCVNWQLPVNNPHDDVAYYPRNYDSITLTTKRVTGPGLSPMEWTYSYGGAISWAPGTGPICTSGDCGAPRCLSDDCAGTAVTRVDGPNNEWVRYTFGNSYRYNEGKLLKTQRGTGSTTLYTERLDYELAQSGQPFPTPIGHSPQARGDGFTSEYLRPQRRKEIVQDGASFTHTVNTFDAFARPTKITRSSTGTGGNHVDPPNGVLTLTAPATNSSGSYTVSWNGIGGTDRYELYLRQNDGSWSRIHNSAGTSRAVTGQGTGAYDYKVRACNSGGCGNYSAIKTTMVTHPPSGVPTLTAPSTDSDGSYTVSWTTVSGATRYELNYRRDNSSWSRAYTGSGTSKALSGLASGTYDHVVRACNVGGCASFSAAKTTRVGPPPSDPPPANPPVLSAPSTVQSGISYTVSWTAVNTATGYVLEQNRSGAVGVTNHTGLSTSRVLSSGSASYRVKACNAAGCSAYSPTKTVTVEDGGSCPGCQPQALPDEEEGDGEAAGEGEGQ